MQSKYTFVYISTTATVICTYMIDFDFSASTHVRSVCENQLKSNHIHNTIAVVSVKDHKCDSGGRFASYHTLHILYILCIIPFHVIWVSKYLKTPLVSHFGKVHLYSLHIKICMCTTNVLTSSTYLKWNTLEYLFFVK